MTFKIVQAANLLEPTERAYQKHRQEIFKQTDRLFLGLLGFEWITSMFSSALFSPVTWSGPDSSPHIHLTAAMLLGFIVFSFPAFLIVKQPGTPLTRHIIAIAQMLSTGLLIQISGGRLEVHFLIFGSLAFLAFYRDWRVLVTASVVVAIDHFVRGLWWPQSVYGVLTVSPLRTLEHVAFVVFEDVFLIRSCLMSTKEMWQVAERQTMLEHQNEVIESARDNIEQQVVARTEELAKSEHRYRRLSAGMPVGVLQTSIDGKAVYANDRWLELMNLKFENIEGFSWLDSVHEDYRERIRNVFDGELDDTKAIVYEAFVRILSELNHVTWAGVTCTSLGVHNGHHEGLVWTFKDISRFVLQEQRVQLQYSLSKIIGESTDFNEAIVPIISTVAKTDGWDAAAIWKANHDGVQTLGIWQTLDSRTDKSRETIEQCCQLSDDFTQQLINSEQTVWSHLTKSEKDSRSQLLVGAGFKSHLAIPIHSGKSIVAVIELFNREYRCPRDAELSCFDGVGVLVGEFYERVKAEEKLHDVDAKTRAMVNGAPDGIITIDAMGIIESVNPAFEELLGFSAEEVVGQPASILLSRKYSKDEIKNFAKGVEDSLVEEKSAPVEVVLCTKDGQDIATELSVSVVTLQRGKFYSGIVRDITERKMIERRVSEFYSTVSHELRTPLTSIRGALGLMEGGVVGDIEPEVLELVTIARSNCDRLIRLINDILDLRKIEAGKLELRFEKCDARELVANSVDGIKGMAAENQIELSYSLSKEFSLMVDKDRIVQVLTNLLSNAIKFSEPGKSVFVDVREHGSNNLRFTVQDYAGGIHKDELNKLFSKFQQLDSSDTRAKGGTGLGLAISKALVNKHGGEIGVDSTFGIGSRFWFDLKLDPTMQNASEAPQPEERHAAFPARTSAARNTRSVPGKVLLVEDDDKLSIILLKLLKSKGYECIRAHSIASAREVLQSEPIVAMLLDLTLPDGDGLEFLATLQNEGSFKVPVIVLTGRERDNSFNSPLLIDWLAKPFDQERLSEAILRATRVSRRQRVLLVEDDASTRAVVSAQLKSLGLDCIEARDGAEGISLVRSKEPDLIVLDLGLPRPDGFEVISVLRSEKSNSTPLLVYTGRDLTSNERVDLSLGMTKHLTKSSSSINEFLNAVKELLSVATDGEEIAGDGSESDVLEGDGAESGAALAADGANATPADGEEEITIVTDFLIAS